MSDENQERLDQLEKLFAAYNLPIMEPRTRAWLQGLKDMPLPTVIRCVDYLIDELKKPDPPKRITIGDVWRASRALRARAPPPKPVPEQPMDEWQAAGNIHLMNHIRKRLAENPRAFGDPGEQRGGRYVRQPSIDFVAYVKRLVRAADQWVADMKDLDRKDGKGVDVELQKRIWVDYIEAAEKSPAKVG